MVECFKGDGYEMKRRNEDLKHYYYYQLLHEYKCKDNEELKEKRDKMKDDLQYINHQYLKTNLEFRIKVIDDILNSEKR